MGGPDRCLPTLPNLPSCAAPKLELGIGILIESADVLAAVYGLFLLRRRLLAARGKDAHTSIHPDCKGSTATAAPHMTLHTQPTTKKENGGALGDQVHGDGCVPSPDPPAARVSHVCGAEAVLLRGWVDAAAAVLDDETAIVNSRGQGRPAWPIAVREGTVKGGPSKPARILHGPRRQVKMANLHVQGLDVMSDPVLIHRHPY